MSPQRVSAEAKLSPKLGQIIATRFWHLWLVDRSAQRVDDLVNVPCAPSDPLVCGVPFGGIDDSRCTFSHRFDKLAQPLRRFICCRISLEHFAKLVFNLCSACPLILHFEALRAFLSSNSLPLPAVSISSHTRLSRCESVVSPR